MTQTPAEDIDGQLEALRLAIIALAQVLTPEQRDQFHMRLQGLQPREVSPGFAWTRSDIVRLTR